MAKRTNNIVLYTTLINWEPLEVERSQGYAWVKTLAKDDQTGARTLLVKYDPGFTAEATVSTWPMDIFTLEGEMRCGERTYAKDTYHYRPAGTPIGPIESPHGITRLIFTADSQDPAKSSSEEVFVQNVQSDVAPDPPVLRGKRSTPTNEASNALLGNAPRAYQYLYDSGHIPADPSSLEDNSAQPTLRWRKILRLDPAAQIAIRVQRVLKAGVRGAPGEIHVHPWIEEVYLVSGNNQDYCSTIDGHWRWIPGVYVCRISNEGFHGNSLKLDDDYYMIVRSGWTDDPAQAAEWKADQDRTARPVPISVSFKE